MIRTRPRALELPAGSPEVLLLDGAAAGIDEPDLRAAAWQLSDGARWSSRSYRYPYALVALSRTRVGVDIERIEHFDQPLLDSIRTPAEPGVPPDGEDPAAFLYSLWCGKEALAKALGDALGYDPRRLEAPMLWPDGRAGAWQALALPVPAGHVGWLCWRAD